jgi:hypothetical protein
MDAASILVHIGGHRAAGGFRGADSEGQSRHHPSLPSALTLIKRGSQPVDDALGKHHT